MARYKDYSYEQTKLIPIAFSQQILPGTFESTLNYLIDNEFDLSVFEQRYHNDETGAPAYDPAILLKIILYGYARDDIEPADRAGLSREHHFHGALGRHPPALYHDCGFYIVEPRTGH
jgi:transposase